MILLSYDPYELRLFVEASLDVILLTAFSTPLIYFFVIQDFIASRDEAIAEMSELAHSVRHQICGALRQINLDGFKAVNDNHA